MKRLQTLRTSPAAAALLYGLLFLAFFQLLTDFVAAIYAFGLLGVDIPPEIGFVLFLLAPLVLMLRKKPLGGRSLAWIAAAALACRAVEPLLPTQARLIATGFGTACLLVVFAGWLSARDGSAPDARELEHGLALATGFAMLLRAAGNGLDLSMVGMFKGIGWLCALIAGALLFLRPAPSTAQETRADPPARFGRVAAACAGMVAALALLYFAFTAPNVIARWADASLMPVILLAFVALVAYGDVSGMIDRLSLGVVLGWNLAFVVVLTWAVGMQRIFFPPDLQSYPLEALSNPWQFDLVVLALLLFPVIFVDFHLFYREIRRHPPSPRAAGGGLGLAGLFLLVLIFMNVFTTVYDYIPVVGPLMRDRYWLVFLVAGVALIAPLVLVDWSRRGMAVGEERRSRVPPISWVFAVCGALGMVLTAIPGFVPYAAPGPEPTLRVMTYNIQQGYDARGQKATTEQLQVMRQADADVIGLQETDTNRIAGGNDDLVRWLARELSMYSYYGPGPEAGTFGIALLSKFPIEHPRSFFMYSTGEQTAGIAAQVYKGGTIYNVIVTHLGNDGPPIQQQAVLREAEFKQNLILMGDFNFDASSPAYRTTVATLADAWWVRWPQGIDAQGFDAAREIDHVFVSPGLTVSDVQYLIGPQSDHPALLVQIGE